MKKFLTIMCCIFMIGITIPLVGCTTKEEPKTFTINFIVEDEIWKTLTSDKMDELSTPTKQYCDFAYWEFDKTSVEDNSCDVYAKFKLNSRYKCTKVLSQSMAPTFSMGDYIIIDTAATEYNVNDIVAYLPTNSSFYIAHRIIEINGTEYTIKADASSLPETISIEQIVGIVCENIGPTLPNDVIG